MHSPSEAADCLVRVQPLPPWRGGDALDLAACLRAYSLAAEADVRTWPSLVAAGGWRPLSADADGEAAWAARHDDEYAPLAWVQRLDRSAGERVARDAQIQALHPHVLTLDYLPALKAMAAADAVTLAAASDRRRCVLARSHTLPVRR